MKTSLVSDETRARLRDKIAASKRTVPTPTAAPVVPAKPLPLPPHRDRGTSTRQKTAKDHAADIMAALPAGKVGDGDTLSTADVVAFTKVKSKTTQQKILDYLAGKGVIVKRTRKPAKVSEKYRPEGVGVGLADATEDKDVVSALTGLGFKKGQASSLASSATGESVEQKIKSALKAHNLKTVAS